MITIKVPCSSANIGPGFDVIGLALSLWLELHVEIIKSASSDANNNCVITYEGDSPHKVSLIAEKNLTTQAALYVLRCHGQRAFPVETRIHMINPIPLGRGLGSSGAAVVAGVVLANEVGKLGLTKARILDYCLMIEKHPDNIAAALFGGFVGTYLNDLGPEDAEAVKEIPLSEHFPSGGEDTGKTPKDPPIGIGHFIKFPWAKELKAIAIIPRFEVSTEAARKVLPKAYKREDVVFNLQRIALLPTALGLSPPDADLIYLAMQDKIHQPYRKGLIPGLPEILQSVTPESHPGLCGICLSGAGPTILALATGNFDAIAKVIMDHIFTANKKLCDWKVLEPAEDGTTVTYSDNPTPVENGEQAE